MMANKTFFPRQKTPLLGDETHPAWRYSETVTQCHATASHSMLSGPIFFWDFQCSQRVVAGQQRNAWIVALTRDALKSIVISIEMVELVKCLLPPVQNEHISWWFDGRSCQAVYAASHTQTLRSDPCCVVWRPGIDRIWSLFLYDFSLFLIFTSINDPWPTTSKETLI